MSKQLIIRSRNHDYPVNAILDEKELVSSIKKISNPKLIIDSIVFEKYTNVFSNLNIDCIVVTSNESNKQLEKVSEICEWLVTKRASKSTNLIGVGGGVIQDLCTFTASIFHRGIPYHLYPTTLLSQSDSCIGAKCALNTLKGKNQLGVIYPPVGVVVCPNFLDTLPESEIRSGYGEILKLSVTGENEFYQYFKSYIEQNGINRVPDIEIIFKSLRAKKPIIEMDEYESNLRRILNYGHSFGHALETLSEHHIVHGDAIVIGMDLINFIGVKIGITSEEFALEFRDLINRNFSHISIPKGMVASEWVQELSKDKKATNTKINFAFAKKVGEIIVKPIDIDENLVDLVDEYLRINVFASF